MNQSLCILMGLICLTLSAMGCGQSTNPSVKPAEVLAPISESTADDAESDISQAEAESFAAAWQKAAAEGDTQAGNELIWFDRMLDRVVESFDLETEFVAGFKEGANSTEPIAQIVRQLSANEEAGGAYRLVRVVNRDGEKHAVFRMLGADGSLNYHDLRIVRDGGRFRADKLFIAMTGEKFSDTFKAVVAPLIAQQTPLSRLTGKSKQALDLLKKQAAIAKAINGGDWALAVRLHDALPAAGQKVKMVQTYHLMALAQFPERETEYLESIEQYATMFPGDPSLALISIDQAVLREDIDLLMKCHRDLSTWSAGDPYLDLMIGAVLGALGKAKEGQAMVSNVDAAALNLASAHDYCLAIAIENEDHAETLKQLMALRDDYGYQFQDLSLAEGFEAFAKSPEFQTWTASSR